MLMENVFPNCTTIILYNVISYLQHCGTLVKVEEVSGLEKTVESMKMWLQKFKPRRDDAVSDQYGCYFKI